MFQPISGFCLVRCSACALHHYLALHFAHVLQFDPSNVSCVHIVCISWFAFVSAGFAFRLRCNLTLCIRLWVVCLGLHLSWEKKLTTLLLMTCTQPFPSCFLPSYLLVVLSCFNSTKKTRSWYGIMGPARFRWQRNNFLVSHLTFTFVSSIYYSIQQCNNPDHHTLGPLIIEFPRAKKECLQEYFKLSTICSWSKRNFERTVDFF